MSTSTPWPKRYMMPRLYIELSLPCSAARWNHVIACGKSSLPVLPLAYSTPTLCIALVLPFPASASVPANPGDAENARIVTRRRPGPMRPR